MSDLKTAALRALIAIEQRQSFDYLDNVIAPELRKALGDSHTFERGCRVCGIGANGTVFGYVCQRTDCPVGITCGV